MSKSIPKNPLSDAEKAGQHWQSLLNRPEPQRLKSVLESTASQLSQSKKIDIYDAIANRKLYSGLVFTCQIGDFPVVNCQISKYRYKKSSTRTCGNTELFSTPVCSDKAGSSLGG
ncbi:Uncharacterised protein [Providencia stuartii]|nr:Uncharacterised protein [Providencia stuartii]